MNLATRIERLEQRAMARDNKPVHVRWIREGESESICQRPAGNIFGPMKVIWLDADHMHVADPA